MTRSKPRRPVSRQVRLNKRVHHIKGGRGDSESFRAEDLITENQEFKESFNLNAVQKVIPDSSNMKDLQEGVSPIKIINKDSFAERKRSLRDSTSLDPKLKVTKSINFNRKNSNEPIRKDNKSYKNSNKHYIVSGLNRSIESIKVNNKKSPSEKVRDTLKNFNKKNELY